LIHAASRPYTYPLSLHDALPILASTLYWASSWIGNNAIAVAAFGYLVTLLPLDGNNPHVQVGGQIVLIWAMFAINLLGPKPVARSEEHTSELQSRENLVCRLLLE